MFKQVLLCYDGSRVGRGALKQGTELAMLVGAQVHVLSCISSDAPDPVVLAGAAGQPCLVDIDAEYRDLLNKSVVWLRDRGVKAQGYLAKGNTLEQIVAYAKRLSVDLIVLGNYPRPTGGRWWSGPERQSLAERVNCAILIAVDADKARP
jgi:nucleotide-binding universal stress UspA family protein